MSSFVFAHNRFTLLFSFLQKADFGFGHFLVMTAHRFASAATLAPYVYIQLVWTIISGYLVFSDVPSIWTVVGAGVVVASGLYLLHRERVVHAREMAAAAGS